MLRYSCSGLSKQCNNYDNANMDSHAHMQEARLDILCVLSRRVSMSGVNLKELASQTEGFTGADLKALLYSAQLAAAHEALDRKKREKESELLESIGSLSDMSPSAAVMGGDSDLSDEERWSINRTSSSATYFTFQSTEAGVTECEDRSHELAPKVSRHKTCHSSNVLHSYSLS